MCQLEALPAGSQQRDLHQAVSLLVSQLGALSRAGERHDPSPEEEGTDAYRAVEAGMLMLSSAYSIKPNSSAVLTPNRRRWTSVSAVSMTDFKYGVFGLPDLSPTHDLRRVSLLRRDCLFAYQYISDKTLC